MIIKNFDQLLEEVIKQRKKRMVAVNGTDAHTLEAINLAVEQGFIEPVVTGNEKEIKASCEKLNIDVSKYEIHHCESDEESVEKAVELIHEGKADIIMKGLLTTDKFMKGLLKKQYELVPPKGIVVHLALMENPNYHKMILFSDAAVIPTPDLKQKIVMTHFLIKAAKALGVETPKVAVIAPTEQIIISIQSCMDGATISKMNEHGQIKGALIEGPVALDVAICKEAAQIKGFTSEVAGDADCLLFPTIDAANVFYKTNTKLANAKLAGIIMGAKVPVVVSSRGDSKETKLNSIALAALNS
ncbi:MAG: phosphate butyryltransferase [Draconibacterium sp.]|nr:MAG: phosphate butyryltransferase [Draconibacterium sp.]